MIRKVGKVVEGGVDIGNSASNIEKAMEIIEITAYLLLSEQASLIQQSKNLVDVVKPTTIQN